MLSLRCALPAYLGLTLTLLLRFEYLGLTLTLLLRCALPADAAGRFAYLGLTLTLLLRYALPAVLPHALERSLSLNARSNKISVL